MPFQATRRMNKKIKNLKWYDISILKIDVVAVTLLLASLFPVLISAHRLFYVAIVVVCELYLMKRMFGSKKGGGCCGSGCCSSKSHDDHGKHHHHHHHQ